MKIGKYITKNVSNASPDSAGIIYEYDGISVGAEVTVTIMGTGGLPDKEEMGALFRHVWLEYFPEEEYGDGGYVSPDTLDRKKIKFLKLIRQTTGLSLADAISFSQAESHSHELAITPEQWKYIAANAAACGYKYNIHSPPRT